MKLKGITKLVLAGTALAATAATLTTSTYAWYVTNAKVDATGVSGKVAATSTGSLFISENLVANSKDTPKDYSNELTLVRAGKSGDEYVQADIDDGKYTFDDLNPQSKLAEATDHKFYYVSKDTTKGSKTYFKAASAANTFEAFENPTDADFKAGNVYEMSETQVWVDNERKLVTPTFVTFKFWLKADQGGTANVKLSLDNTSTTVNAQVIQNAAGKPTAVTGIGSELTADAVHALRMDVVQQNGIKDAEGTTTADVVNYQLGAISKDKTGNTAYATATSTAATQATSVVFTDLTGGDANKYYKAILKKAGYNTDATNGASDDDTTGLSTWTSVSLTAGKDTLLTFRIWLEGSDKDCWDSCRGQTFTLDFNFELQSQANQQQNP